MTIRKFGSGRVLDEESKAIDKAAASKTEWTPEDQAALRDENQK